MARMLENRAHVTILSLYTILVNNVIDVAAALAETIGGRSVLGHLVSINWVVSTFCHHHLRITDKCDCDAHFLHSLIVCFHR
jgi:hypothetical protein